MKTSSKTLLAALLALPGFVLTAEAVPRIGYVYPAGGKAGSSFEIEIGGQRLGEPLDVLVSGEGVRATIRDHNKLPPAAVIRDYRDKLNAIKPALRKVADQPGLSPTSAYLKMERLLAEAELSEKKIWQIDLYSRQRADKKRQLNTQIGETVRARIDIEAKAEPGIRYCRLLTKSGLSNPLRFVVGTHREGNEPEPWVFDLAGYVGARSGKTKPPVDENRTILTPATINGRILPGEVDEFTFRASEGEQVVISLQARNLIPYLADAVPGWFQAVMSLHDPDGKEIAFVDDYRFDPDPVLFYKIPRDGNYRIRIHDSIYRGREDFVYRLTVGELPFLTGIFPLGGPAGGKVNVKLSGGNLSEGALENYPLPEKPGIIGISVPGEDSRSNALPFHVDDSPEEAEREPNDRMGAVHAIDVPGLVNGSIGKPGDVDFYRVQASGGRPLTAEIFARRLGSPLDANLTVFDTYGKHIAFNGGLASPPAGPTPHHADARVTVKIPGGGACFVRVADTQHRGGSAFAYRLKFTQGEPAVALRAVPSSINAKPGGTAKLTVHALRLDGFEGQIKLELKDAPVGFELKSGGVIAASEEKTQVTIGVTGSPTDGPVKIALQGSSGGDGRGRATFDVVPAEDMMQAFIWRHLVPVDALWVDVRTPPVRPAPAR